MTSRKLGKVQLQIMEILWQRGAATAREITDELSRQSPISHSTVQTLLRKLEAKGAVTHEASGRIFIFRPLFEQTEVTASATNDLLTRIFKGSVSGLLAHLLKHEKISDEELKRLRKLIKEADKK